MMRIITGKAKGIRLKTLEGNSTRPTAERVKEAVFSMLQGDIEGRNILDLFSGSGQMALEALSRGAAYAVAVDKSTESVKIINENAKKTKLASQCDVVYDDYIGYIKKNADKQFDLVFLDPPYTSGYYSTAICALLEYQMLKPSSLIVCESGDEDPFDSNDAINKYFSVVKQSRYGRTFITIISPKEGEESI